LRVVADLIKPTRGSVKLFGGPATTVRRRREIGFVFQAATLLPWRTAARNVRLPLELARTAKRRPSPDPVELLGLVGLAGRENAYPHELSGGMRQRVAIARALVNQPKILLMDEPFGALDEINRDRLNEELLRVWTHTGVTTLFVTHSIAEAIFLAQRVVVMDKHGRLREIVDIPLPYPRSLDIRDTAGFTDIAAHLRKTLRAD
jgi:NitT/TauT family transport system ATP-binding protein